MVAGEFVTDPTYPYPGAAPARSLPGDDESAQRRERYDWLYDDEDIWAPPA